jgi:hypothetical protein
MLPVVIGDQQDLPEVVRELASVRQVWYCRAVNLMEQSGIYGNRPMRAGYKEARLQIILGESV